MTIKLRTDLPSGKPMLEIFRSDWGYPMYVTVPLRTDALHLASSMVYVAEELFEYARRKQIEQQQQQRGKDRDKDNT